MKPVLLVFTEPGAGRAGGAWLWGHRPGRARKALMAGTLATMLGLFLVAAGEAWRVQTQLRDLQTRLEAARAKNLRVASAARKPPPQATALTAADRRAWNQVLVRLNTPWPAIFDALVQTMPANIALLSLEPDALQGSVRLQIEGRDLDTLLAYAGSLGAVAPFGGVLLMKHETNDQDAMRPLRLSVDLRVAQPVAAAPAWTGQPR